MLSAALRLLVGVSDREQGFDILELARISSVSSSHTDAPAARPPQARTRLASASPPLLRPARLPGGSTRGGREGLRRAVTRAAAQPLPEARGSSSSSSSGSSGGAGGVSGGAGGWNRDAVSLACAVEARGDGRRPQCLPCSAEPLLMMTQR
eukprot:355871-Chlamydomonas_euryale.AAC.8